MTTPGLRKLLCGACILAVVGCGQGQSQVQIDAVGVSSLQSGASATIAISGISVSETGAAWTMLNPSTVSLNISANSSAELALESLPLGEYHGLRFDLEPGFSFYAADGSVVTGQFPDILMYVENGIYRYSNSGNGYPDTNEYFMFTTRNGGLTAPIDVEPNEISRIIIELEPQYGFETSLAARVRYSAFTY